MAEDSRDVLMSIILKGSPIPAECNSVVDASKDVLAKGFTSGSASGAKANFFALDEFQLDLGLIDDADAGSSDPTKRLRAMNNSTQKQIQELWDAQKKQAAGKPLGSGGEADQYIRFMSKGRPGLRSKSYTSDLNPVQLTKGMDASSLTLFKACKDKTVLDSAVIIKRRGGGGNQLRTYLRIEFTSLLITKFAWDEDDVVKESIEFVCRKMQAQYSIEKDDGTMKTPGQPGGWSMLGPSK